METLPKAWPEWLETVKTLSLSDFIAWALRTFSPALAFSTSLGREDQLLLWQLDQTIAALGLSTAALDIFTLDTGRLHPETYELWETNRESFRLPVRGVYPEASAVEAYVNAQGINGFYRSLESRKACCQVRKVEPLKRALKGKRAWITGRRADQAATRQKLPLLEWDSGFGLVKINPLAEWTQQQIEAEIALHKIPVSALHAQGYPSIGCAPCTRPIADGEEERAGRWWWENPEHKECGLHLAVEPKFRFQREEAHGPS